jgi:hypothetical protein
MARMAARPAGDPNACILGIVCAVKVWYHLVAALVGLAIAALIVWWVFGHASEQGATQEGSAGALGAAETQCGTITPAELNGEAARATAAKNLPVLANEEGPIPSISDDHPDQKAWFARIHAAAGLCADEIKVDDKQTTITMSTIDSVSEADASKFAAAAIAEAFTPPLNRSSVKLEATVDGTDRTVVITRRAWNAFQIAREARNRPLDMHSLAQFRQTTSFKPTDLRVVGWK